ncbi:lipopolysaccharide biosynthesis protein [Streptosporangium sandarakinum]|uniref:lipopolysaccharide biosynthesis protein n=1 Tax=Streptosporangium sandarakinum TaxID=1260955 RepID=UPI0037BA7085
MSEDHLARVVQTMVSQALPLALAAMAGVFLARALQPEGRGVYATITTTAGIAIALGHLSVGRSQMVFWPARERRRFLVGNALILGLALGLAAGLVALGAVLALIPLPAPHLMIMALAAVPFGVAAVNLKGILLLRSQNGLVNRSVVTAALVLYLPILTLAVLGRLTLPIVVVCWSISTVVPFALFVRSLGRSAVRGEAALAREQLSLSGRYHIGPVAFHLLLTVDVLLLNAFVSPAEVGLYTTAMAFLSLARIPTDAMAQVTLPHQAVEDESSAQGATLRTIRLNLLLSSISVGALAVASPTLIPLLYGAPFAGSVTPLLFLATGMVAWSLLRPVEQYLVRLRRPMTMASVAVGALTANLGMNAVLIPRYGAAGAALASSVSYTAMAVVEVLWFARTAGAGARDLLPRPSDLRSVVSLLSCAGRGARTVLARRP